MISVTIEARGIFEPVVEMALDPTSKPALLPKLLERYRLEHRRVLPRHYADKSHPSLWIAEDLASAFPEAVFIGIKRDPYATIASMLRHGGVLAWFDRWLEFPVPNSFLGISADDAASYESRGVAAKCALRWKAHAEQMGKMQAMLNDRLLVVSYERLVTEPEGSVSSIQSFLRLEAPFEVPTPREESMWKWRSQLSEPEVAEIASVVGYAPQQ